MNLKLLADPFKEDEIEWRIGQCGMKGGKPWAMVLAYVQARAIMNRLDEVCGPENWRVSYEFVQGAQSVTPGVLASLSIRIGDRWVTKTDGAEQTDIESFKGGLSSALKRAGSVWGIGRYLYQLDAAFANINPNGKHWGRVKDGPDFNWDPPRLPAWALPPGAPTGSNGIHPQQPGPQDGHILDKGYVIPFGKWKARSIEEVCRLEGPEKLKGYINYLEESAIKQNKPILPGSPVALFIDEASSFLAAFESGEMTA